MMHSDQTRKSTMAGNIVFLLISFPLGLIYFLITVIGFAVGVGTLVIWIGLPILFATLFLIRAMAGVERRMVSSLLHMPFPHHLHDESHTGFLRSFGKILADPYTWTSMVYMILKLPLGILSFVLALTLPLVSTVTTLMPLAYLVNLFVNVILLKSGVSLSYPSGIIIPYFIEVHGTFDQVMFIRSFVGVPVGIIFWIVTRFVLNGLAAGSGELARALLVQGEAENVIEPEQEEMPAQLYEQQAYMARGGRS